MVDGDPWMQLALITLVIPLLAAMKGAIRTIAVNELLPEWRGEAERVGMGLDVARARRPVPFSWNFIRSLVTKHIRWRGIRYELIAANQVRILRN